MSRHWLARIAFTYKSSAWRLLATKALSHPAIYRSLPPIATFLLQLTYHSKDTPIHTTITRCIHEHQSTQSPISTSKRSETLTRPPNQKADPTKLQKRTWRTAGKRAEEWSSSATSHTVSMLDPRDPATRADTVLQASVKSRFARSSAAPARW